MPSEVPPPLTPGDVLPGGRFAVDDVLATGGRAVVWRGTDSDSGQPVAIKTPRPELVDDAEAHAQFRTEAAVGRLVDHPALVRTIDLIEAGPQPYLIQPLAPGDAIGQAVRQGSPLPYRTALTALAQVARGLRALHTAGYVHRDVGANNILWDGQRATLIDFGIALPVGTPPLTADSLVPGNPDYLAPELSLGRNATPAADLYSLAVVFLYTITGTQPFRGATPEDIAAAHVMQPPPHAPAGLPSDLRYLIHRMLDRDPSARPSNALAVARLFEGFARA